MSTFGGISVGLSGLNAAQQALDVAGENLANQNTVGYTRRRADLTSTGASTVPAIWARSSTSGAGVTVTGISRVGDDLLGARLGSATGDSALAAGQQAAATSVQDLFDEPGDNGLQAGLTNLWSSFSDLASDPTSASLRGAVLGRAAQVTTTLHGIASGLTSLGADTTTSLKATVAAANTAAAQVADLNGRIASASGDAADTLSDQRDQLLQSLASSVGATWSTASDGSVAVRVGGTNLVSGTASLALAVAGSGATTAVTVASTGSPAGITGGDAGADVDTLSRVIPQRQTAIDAVASSLATQVNGLQAAGYDQSGAAGQPFFSGTTAATLAVALADGSGIAASSNPPTGGTASRDGGVATQLGELGSTGAADASYQSLVADVGSAVQTAARASTAADATKSSVAASLDSVTGVSADEESASLVQYQRAYEGSAKYLSVLDQVFQTLIDSVTS